MGPRQNKADVLKGVFILTIGAILTKILSAVYRIPFQNMVGTQAFIYTSKYILFMDSHLFLTTSGFPLIISKLYAEKKEQNDLNGANQLLIISFIFLFIVGLTAFAFMYLSSDWLAGKMNDPNLALLFRVIQSFSSFSPLFQYIEGIFKETVKCYPPLFPR